MTETTISPSWVYFDVDLESPLARRHSRPVPYRVVTFSDDGSWFTYPFPDLLTLAAFVERHSPSLRLQRLPYPEAAPPTWRDLTASEWDELARILGYAAAEKIAAAEETGLPADAESKSPGAFSAIRPRPKLRRRSPTAGGGRPEAGAGTAR